MSKGVTSPSAPAPDETSVRAAEPACAAFVAAQRQALPDWLNEAMEVAGQRLARAADEAGNAAARATSIELGAELAAHRSDWQERFAAALDLAIDIDERGADADAANLHMPFRLELIADADVDEDIAISRLIQTAEAGAGSALHDVAMLYARLADPGGGPARSYPLRPQVIARGLRKAVAGLGLPGEHRLLLLQEMGMALAAVLAPAYKRQRQALDALARAAEPVELRLRALPAVPQPAVERPREQRRRPRDAAAAPRSGDSSLRQLRESLGDPKGAGPGAAMAQMMRLVAQRVPPGGYLENLVRRLARPACLVADQNPEVWQTLDHPLWRLLDRVLAAGAVHIDLDSDLPDDIRTLEEALRGLEAAVAPRAGDCLAVEQAVDSRVAELDDTQAASIAHQVDAMQARVDRSEIEAALRAQIAEQMQPVAVPLAVRHFLLDTWTAVMGRSSVQHGIESEAFRTQGAFVEVLLSAAALSERSPLAAGELARLINPAGQALAEAGFAEALIGVELSRLARALRRAPSAVAVAPPQARTQPLSPEDAAASAPAAPRSRSRRRTGAAEPGPPQRPEPDAPRDAAETGLHDALETVLLDRFDPTRPDVDAAPKAESWVDGLAPGAYCRLFLLDRWMNTRLSWRSDNGSMFIFASRHQGRCHSLSRRALVKLRHAGLAATIERGASIAEVMAELAQISQRRPPRPPRGA
ncbi:MAG: DUF1631 family protein [Burkholderiales bacterium]|nr:DUF1631 family protein [Burkholderiales bacterium]